MSLQVEEVVAGSSAPRRRKGIRYFLRKYTFSFALVLAVVLFIVDLILKPNFDPASQLATFAPLALAAVASTPAIVSGRGGIDISISPLMILTGVLYAVWLVPNGLGGFAALPILLLVGAAVGALNGLLIVGLRLQPVIVTVSTFFVMSGLNTKLAPQPVSIGTSWLTVFAGSIGFFPAGLLVILVPAIVWVVLKRSAYGRTLYTVGGNHTAAFSTGINVNATRVVAFALGGLFAAIGGMALVGLVGAADASTSASYSLIGIAAVALGGTSLMGGRGGILGSILGAAVIYLLQSLLGSLGVSQVWLQVAYGTLLLLAVVIGAQLSAAPKEKK